MRRLFALLLIIIMSITIVSGCQSERRPSISNNYKFGATYMTLNNPFFVALNNGIKDVVEANGDTLIALDPALDVEKQISQIEDLIAQEVDAIFVSPADWKAIRPALIKAKEAGIPIINVDSPVYDTELVISIVASDNYNAGVICAKDMMKKLSAANIVILEHPTAKSAIDRTQGFIDTLKDVAGYEIVAKASSEGQLEQAMPVMGGIILDNSNIDVVMALNDPTAMGAVAALQAAGREEGVLVYGVDGAPEAKQMILDGKMTASAAQSPMTIGRTAAQVAYDYLAGKEIKKEIFVDITLIDKTNVAEIGTKDWQ